MEFRTKLDFSSNRQIKQYPETSTILSGGTVFGVPFSALTYGPDLTTTAITSTITGITSTFSGNSGTTSYIWYNSNMSVGNSFLSALTPTNSGTTQFVEPIFSSSSTTIIDGNTVSITYSGISFDITPTTMVNLGGGNYSGSVYTNILNYYSAGTLDFTGRTIWADVKGITKTEKLIITNVGTGPGSIDIGVDATGLVVNQASDIRLKENIEPINYALNKVLMLSGVSFNWINKVSGGNERKLGLIAQQVKDIVPELVNQTSDGYLSVNYKDLSALLIEAIKEIVGQKLITNNIVSTQTIIAEDNNIELNFNGSNETSIGGGIIINKGIDDNTDSKFIIDDSGNWVTNNSLIPKSLIIPEYTPVNSNDNHGNIGDITKDENYLYIKGNNIWKRIRLEDF